MILEGSLLLFVGFAVLLAIGAPLAVALGITGTVVILGNHLGIMSVPTNAYDGIAKYPLLALPVFVLAGMMFERAGVALRIVRFAAAIVGPRRGAQGIVAILVCMFLGGISGSGPADAAAVAMVMIPGMLKQGYPREFSATLIAAAGATAILIPPSIALIVYSVLVPSASVPALLAGGMIPGVMAGLALVAPTLWFSWKYGWGTADPEPTPGFWKSLKEAIWGLLAPVIILGGLRAGLFTPTEAAVVAAFYGFFVGLFVYRTLTLRAVYEVLVDSAEISAVVLLIISLAGVFAHAGSTLGAFDAFAHGLLGLTTSEPLMLLVITIMLLIAGMLLDAVSIFLVFLPILMPIAQAYHWDPVWFGIILTMNMAIGQFTPPMAVNLMVTTRIAGMPMESTVRWALWLVAAMLVALALVTAFPGFALWLPHQLGY
ncbi:MAG: TRAP transporter large permease [Burkholderiaceae bacterium]